MGEPAPSTGGESLENVEAAKGHDVVDSGRMDGERAQQSTLARLQDEVIGALAERVEVESIAEQPSGLVLITIRLTQGIAEQARLSTEEWVQLQLIALEDAQAPAEHVYVARYV
jgi:hypothetical protein